MGTRQPPVRELRLILGDQLNPKHSWLSQVEPDVVYLLVESHEEQNYVRHHLQKVLTVLGAMRRFAEHLKEQGHRVEYVRLGSDASTRSVRDNLVEFARHLAAKRICYQEPDEFRLDQALSQLREFSDCEVQMVSSEHFFTTREELGVLFQGKKQWRMETYYRQARVKHEILMDGRAPLGGDWNYDVKNRKRWPRAQSIPPLLALENDVQEVAADVQGAGISTLGQADASRLPWALDREQALALLDFFIQQLLPDFGPLQDAMTSGGWALFHSRIAQALNMKMLAPREVVQRVEEAYRADPERIPLESCEGFIRQIVGWREYVRGVYWAKMPAYGEENYLGAKRKLPTWYWDAKTKMACLRHAIGQSLEHSYAHHIQRLMITGNFALIAGIDPDEVDAWYLGIYADAFEWVQLPNTRGMSQFADGGFLGSKPYAAGANYTNKMGDHCKGCHYDPKKKVGDGACPLSSLYWHFFERHRELLEHHPRIGMAYRSWSKMAESDRQAILGQAERYLARINDL